MAEVTVSAGMRAVPTYEFHVSRESRDYYQFDEAFFTLSGNVVFADFHAARVFAQQMNDKRDLLRFPEQAVRAGDLIALGLIDEILHFVVAQYREQNNPLVIRQALQHLYDTLGRDAVDAALRRFADDFPPLAVYKRENRLDEYLEAGTGGVPHREMVLEEMLMLWITNVNPAASPFLELFDDGGLEQGTAYPRIMVEMHNFFGGQPTFGPDQQNLIDLLRAPAVANPHSLSAQLEYVRERWGRWGLGGVLLRKFLYRLLAGLDLIKEEGKAFLFVGPGGPGPARVYDFSTQAYEPERFSPDKDWMPRLVLIAKNTYVWLDQLAKKYGRPVTRLDQVPDEELDLLARRGMTGLWLIGVWERSKASAHIKQMMGNPEAVASAYSLYDYTIAEDLGGSAAYQALKERAWRHGLRMASDMVPNHMAIDSRWVIEHPDWFVQLDHSPFPSYSFGGPDLSPDGRVGIYLEDHYYSRSDAAVVFRRNDRQYGGDRYLYHGNDGTSMPWNDTAQLNYLLPEVREAVIQTILHVARQFPVIRFDAAMTLAKKHYQRLWYPEPGTGGDIPSRAGHGLTKEQFDAAMPEEFWREVVDRVAAEAPDTLLLAEAFWLLEGYFVRTLGMHRVYNSAFMNMMRDEDNAKYRQVMKNTLEFDPEILKRYVNFMNNPDERTAVDQFGSGDKYFGVATVMSTLPGLPMYGHGQVEGFGEKYGMEYRRAYWDEQANGYMVERHQRELAPILHRRYLFAEVEHFLLYDFYTPEGHVDENVFAYSNRSGDERGLVLYHNAYAGTRGWVRTSAAFSLKAGQGDERQLVTRTLGEGLGLRAEPGYFYVFRDQASSLEYIRKGQDLVERGLYVELGAYQYHVYLDWREVREDEWQRYSQLHDYLDGRGVPNVDEAIREIFLQPIHAAFKQLVGAGMLRRLIEARAGGRPEPEAGSDTEVAAEVEFELEAGPAGAAADEPPMPVLLDEVEARTVALLSAIKGLTKAGGDEVALAARVRREVEGVLQLPEIAASYQFAGAREARAALMCLGAQGGDPLGWGIMLNWTFVHALGRIAGESGADARSRSWIDEWLLGRLIAGSLVELGVEENLALQAVAVIKALTAHQHWFELKAAQGRRAYGVLQSLLADAEIQRLLQINRYQGILWYNKEAFEQMLRWLMFLAAVDTTASQDAADDPESVPARILATYRVVRKLRLGEKHSAFQVEKLLDAVKTREPAVPAPPLAPQPR